MDDGSLISNINKSNQVVAVVGLGRMGFPLMDYFSSYLERVIAVDEDQNKVEKLRNAINYMTNYTDSQYYSVVTRKNLKITSSMECLSDADVILICIPTPYLDGKGPEFSYITRILKLISLLPKRERLIVLEYTSYPGFSEEVVLPLLAENGLHDGENFYFAVGTGQHHLASKAIDKSLEGKIVAADHPRSREIVKALYSKLSKLRMASSIRIAEAVRVHKSAQFFVNQALISELHPVFSAMDLETNAVVSAAATKPFGFRPYYLGCGVSGAFLPVDPMLLAWTLRRHDVPSHMIELSGDLLAERTRNILRAIESVASNRLGLALSNARIVVFGMASEEDSAHVINSAAERVLLGIEAMGAQVDVCDPLLVGDHSSLTSRLCISFEEFMRRRETYSFAIYLVDHSEFDKRVIVRNVPFVIDPSQKFGGPLIDEGMVEKV